MKLARVKFRWMRALAGVSVLLFASFAPAFATTATTGNQTIDVSCDGTSITSGRTVTQATDGPFKVKQVNTNPNSPSVVWAESSQGNNLPNRFITDGATGSWTGVQGNSNYHVWVHRDGASNCNGIGLGHGNYAWTYNVTHTV